MAHHVAIDMPVGLRGRTSSSSALAPASGTGHPSQLLLQVLTLSSDVSVPSALQIFVFLRHLVRKEIELTDSGTDCSPQLVLYFQAQALIASPQDDAQQSSPSDCHCPAGSQVEEVQQATRSETRPKGPQGLLLRRKALVEVLSVAPLPVSVRHRQCKTGLEWIGSRQTCYTSRCAAPLVFQLSAGSQRCYGAQVRHSVWSENGSTTLAKLTWPKGSLELKNPRGRAWSCD